MPIHVLPRSARADVKANGCRAAVYDVRAKVRLDGGYWTTRDNTWKLDVWVAGVHAIKGEELKTKNAAPPLDKAMQAIKEKVESIIRAAHGSTPKISYVDLEWQRQV